jgi:hypothetical protein
MGEDADAKEGNESERQMKEHFAQLTDVCAQSVTEGWLDVYQTTYEQLKEDAHSRPHVDGGEEKNEQMGEEKGEGQVEEEEEEWVVKESAEAASMKGPFTARELMDEAHDGVVKATAVVRKVGTTVWQPIDAMSWWTHSAG